MPARLFVSQLGIDGGPVSEVLTVTAGGEIAVYQDSHDGYGVPGRFTLTCSDLNEVEAPWLFERASCSEPLDVMRAAPGAR